MTALGDLVWTDLTDRRPVLVLPLGSTEQHGPHLPLDTDTRIAVAIARRAVESRDDAVLGPALAIGASGEHAGFPGTLSIGTEALTNVLIELVRSADAFAGVVLVNGHGGNVDAVRAAIATSTAEGRVARAWSPSIPDGDAHAGRSETSLLLAIDPTCVRIDALAVGNDAPVSELLDDLRSGGVRAVSANGVLGDATSATREEGAALLDRLVADLRAQLDAWFPA